MSEKQNEEIEAVWADKSQESKVVRPNGYYQLGIICVGIILLVMVIFALEYDPILSKKF